MTVAGSPREIVVNPARAGMILVTNDDRVVYTSKPRASGDDPEDPEQATLLVE